MGLYDAHLHIGSVRNNGSIIHVSIMKTNSPPCKPFSAPELLHRTSEFVCHKTGFLPKCAEYYRQSMEKVMGEGTTTKPEIGDEMPDGTIYAGISPDTHKPMFATPADAPGTYTFNEAAKYAKNLDAHGHHDFRPPSKGELNMLFQNRNKGKLAGTFNATGSCPAGWYWSSSPISSSGGWAQCYSDGNQVNYFMGSRYYASSLRCVR
jgi:hypothetical protein